MGMHGAGSIARTMIEPDAKSGSRQRPGIQAATLCEFLAALPSVSTTLGNEEMSEGMLQEHDFTLVLTGVDGRDDEVADALELAGCDDATFSYQHGMYRLEFGRIAATLRDAITSAIKDVHRSGIGVQVRRVDSCSLVTQAEIARKLGTSRAAINQLVSRQRGDGSFPAPVCSLGNQSLWAWCDVACWARRNDYLTDAAVADAKDVAMVNVVLDYLASQGGDPALFESLMAELAIASSKTLC